MYKNRPREVRESHGYRQDDVADVIGVSRSTYSLMEAGKRGISTDKLIKLADFYKCTTDELLGSWAWYEYATISIPSDNKEEDNGEGNQ